MLLLGNMQHFFFYDISTTELTKACYHSLVITNPVQEAAKGEGRKDLELPGEATGWSDMACS